MGAMDDLAQLTPAICQANGYRLSAWCRECRRWTTLPGWDFRAFRLRWDTPIEMVCGQIGFRCRHCRGPAEIVEVSRRTQFGSRFVTALKLVRGVRVEIGEQG